MDDVVVADGRQSLGGWVELSWRTLHLHLVVNELEHVRGPLVELVDIVTLKNMRIRHFLPSTWIVCLSIQFCVRRLTIHLEEQ